MSSSKLPQGIDWNEIKCVVFDVDGTLYDQTKLRRLMLFDLIGDAISKMDLQIIFILKHYRKLRESMADQEVDGFELTLIELTAKVVGCSEDQVRAAVELWILKRPIRYISKCMHSGLPELFNNLRKSGKLIGVLSDYPADEKLLAMGLAADFIVCASDPKIAILKPHPRGLIELLQIAKINPNQTVLIGDRPERDGLVAERVGVRSLIFSRKKICEWQTISSYYDSIFDPLQK